MDETMEKRRVVITGMGVISPIGNSIEEVISSLDAGRHGFAFIDRFDTSDFDVKICAPVKDFCAENYIEKKEARRMDAFTQYAVAAAADALKDCSSDLKDLDPYRVGVIVGAGIGGIGLTEQERLKMEEKGPDRVSVFYIPMMIGNMAAGTVSMRTGFKGDNFCTTTACSSGAHAIGEAFRKIKDGYLDACIAGGTESCIGKFPMAGFNNMKALTRSTDLDRCSIPFDKERNGFVLGEGSGMLVLEEYEHAKARGARIYAELAGYGATGDAYHMTSPAPDGSAAGRAMLNAYTEAGFNAADVTYINAHGTSTGLNDKYETAAIKLALGEYAYKTVVSSTKSLTGHLLGAAGAVEAVITALSISRNTITGTYGYKVKDEECDLDICPNENRQVKIKCALSNSLGFGGHNATLCFADAER